MGGNFHSHIVRDVYGGVHTCMCVVFLCVRRGDMPPH